MRKEDGLSIISLIIIVVILIVILGMAAKVIFGEDGIVEKYSQADNEYNKSEIVEKLNFIIKEKYVLDYKFALENKKDINELYTEETAFQYLLDNGHIEPLKDIDDNLVEDQYFINAETLNSDIATNAIRANGSKGNGTKIYKIKKVEEKLEIFFVDKYGEEEEIGELILKPEI